MPRRRVESVFEIIGPVMVGPSSSHTAGAVRIGRLARELLGDRPVYAKIVLHGSFAETYRGHGTDRAIVAGLLGFAPDDERIRDAFSHAKREGLKFEIVTADLGEEYHPNTAKITLRGEKGETIEVVGSSIGGGHVEIVEINGFLVSISGTYHTLVTIHRDVPGVAAKITSLLASRGINIARMNITRKVRGEDACASIEVDQEIPEDVVRALERYPEIRIVRHVRPI
ncbi:MAG: L-serine ammonia-lyase, iron-sulfur-dependent subunit beta [Candidatus Baldrarchaeia archaeon]